MSSIICLVNYDVAIASVNGLYAYPFTFCNGSGLVINGKLKEVVLYGELVNLKLRKKG